MSSWTGCTSTSDANAWNRCTNMSFETALGRPWTVAAACGAGHSASACASSPRAPPVEESDFLQRPDRAAHTALEPWLLRPVVAKLADKGMAGHAQAQWVEYPRDGDARGQRSCRVRPSVSEAAGQEDRSGGNQPRRTHTRAGRWRGSGRGAADR